MLKQFFSHRSHQAAFALIGSISFFCTQAPLFNYLGFEFSALIAVLASPVAGLLTISFWNKSNRSYAARLWLFARDTLVVLSLLLVLPLLIISANALFVKNCSFLQGLILYLLLSVPAVFFAHSLALLIAVTARKLQKTLFLFVWVLVLLHIVYVTITGPQIYAFNPIIGFFPGFTYDETLDVISRLLIYRASTVIASLVFIIIAVLAERRARSKKGEARNIAYQGVIGVLAVGLLGFFLLTDQLGISSSDERIERELGGKLETDHFVILFPDTMVKGRRLEHLVQLHEFYFDQLGSALRVEPQRKIRSYLYASSEQKGRLIGAGGTNIAKPWLRQIHLNLGDVESSLKHELAHVMAAEFGFPFLRVGVNSGLIEGLATATERIEYDEQLHRLASMVLALGAEPDMESLFSLTGFMKAHPSVGYVLAGSFCRFLIDRYGIRRFKLVYQSGDFSTFYNKPLPALLADWRRYVGRYILNDHDVQKAAYLFKRPTIFAKECARVIANMNADTRSLYTRKQYEAALESATRSLQQSTSLEAIAQRTNVLFRLQKYSDVIAFAEEKLRDSTIAHTVVTLKLTLGDSYWAIDSVDAARKLYQDLSLMHINNAWDEASTIRLETIYYRNSAHEILPYFTTEMPDSQRVSFLRKMIGVNQTGFVSRYLLARELAGREKYEEAIGLLESIKRMKYDVLEYHRQRRLAGYYFALGRYQKSKLYYWQALNYMTNEAQAFEIDERLKLCDWMEERAEMMK